MKQMLIIFENPDEALIIYVSTVVLSSGHILFLISPSKTFSKQALDQSGRILNEYLPSTTITDTR